MVMNTKDKRTAQAKRLSDAMKQAGKRQTDLIRLTKLRFDIPIKSGHLSMILKAERSLPDDYAEYFASILGIDYGYLTGADKYIASSYDEYLDLMGTPDNWKERLQADVAELHKYDFYLDACGYKVIEANFAPDGAVEEYKIRHMGKEATIPADKMMDFKMDVDEYIQKALDPLVKKYKT